MDKRRDNPEYLRSVIGCLLEAIEPLHDGCHAQCQICLDVLSAQEVVEDYRPCAGELVKQAIVH